MSHLQLKLDEITYECTEHHEDGAPCTFYVPDLMPKVTAIYHDTTGKTIAMINEGKE